MYTVYVLRNQLSGKIYIGQTHDLNLRLNRHNKRKLDKRSYTALNKGKWVVVYKEFYKTRQEVLKREKELKSSRGRDFIKKKILGR